MVLGRHEIHNHLDTVWFDVAPTSVLMIFVVNFSFVIWLCFLHILKKHGLLVKVLEAGPEFASWFSNLRWRALKNLGLLVEGVVTGDDWGGCFLAKTTVPIAPVTPVLLDGVP